MMRPSYLALWVVLLMKANHENKRVIWNGKDTEIKAGSFITGRKALHKDTKIPQSTIEDILNYLETQQQIRQQKNNKYRIITILNWNTYQNPTAKATSSRHLADTNKNEKNEKKRITIKREEEIQMPIDVKNKLKEVRQHLLKNNILNK